MSKSNNTFFLITLTIGLGFYVYTQFNKNKKAGGDVVNEQQVYSKHQRNIIIT